jgi:hypothetical protein
MLEKRPEHGGIDHADMPGVHPEEAIVEHTGTPGVGPVAAAAIRSQLDRLLASQHLRSSRRCQALLKFVVEASLDGHLDKVKERCIGFEVFGRNADYDTSQDSVVRTAAAEVRKRLAQYYQEPEHANEIRFVLPNGSYSPGFRFPDLQFPPALEDPTDESPAGGQERDSGPAPVLDTPEADPPRRRRPARRPIAAGAIAGAALLAVASYAYFQPSDFDRFWKPVVQDGSPVVICIEQPLRIYRFTGPRSNELNEKMIGTPHTPPMSREARENSSVDLSELTTAGGQYFSCGDLIATTMLTEMLARRNRPFVIMGDRMTSLYDLHGKPAILLGQLNNQWTLDLTRGFRYYLEEDPAGHHYELRDRRNPGKIVASTQEGERREELAVISRVVDGSTEKAVVAVAATNHTSTLAAGGFLTDPEYLRQAWQGAPSGWYRKNIQIVLRCAIVQGAPGPPRVIATYFW